MSIEERLYDAGFEDVVYFPDFGEECVIGIDTSGRAVYSFEKMVDHLIKDGMSDIEAIEYIEYNTVRALPYINNQTEGKSPIVVYSMEWLGV